MSAGPYPHRQLPTDAVLAELLAAEAGPPPRVEVVRHGNVLRIRMADPNDWEAAD